MPDKLTEYLEQVMAQICWRRARPALRGELRSHLLCQLEDCRAAGMDEEDAAEETVRQMGDPAEAGAALNAIHRPVPQWGLLALTLAIVLTGGFLRVWLTAGWGYDAVDPGRTVLTLCLGTVCLLVAYFSDYTALCRHGKAVYLGMLLLSLVSLALSPDINNASYYTRYLTELYPLVYALWICAWRGKGWSGLAASLLGGALLAALSMLAPGMWGLLLLLTTGCFLLVAAVCQGWFTVPKRQALALTFGTAAILTGAGLRLVLLGYGQNRLLTAIHPEREPLGGGYQSLVVRRAVSGAQWLGEGTMGAACSGYAYEEIVPEAGKDFLLTTVIHKLGWLPGLLLLAATAALVIWLFLRCRRLKDPLGRTVVQAAVLSLGLETAMASALNLGFVLYSVHFPLLVGNLHTAMDMALIGMALSAFREAHLPAWQPCPAAVSASAETVSAESK